MSLTLEFVINPIITFVAVVGAALVGYLVSRVRLAKQHARIKQLETEMMSSHAEILEMQKVYVKMEAQLKEQFIPVIPMKISGKDTNNPKEKANK